MIKTCVNCLTEYDDQFDICPKCGFFETPQPDGKCLKAGTCLESRYVVGSVEYLNSVSIGYMGYDPLSRQKILISEYFPEYIVKRESGNKLTVCNPENDFEFQKRKNAIGEAAKRQAKFCRLPPVMKVIDVICENGTVYVIYRYEGGTTLANDFKSHIYDQVAAVDILKRILTAIEILHSHKLSHGNISPDSIYITADNEIKLINFGFYPFGDCAMTVVGHHQTSGYNPNADVRALIILFYTLNSANIPPAFSLRHSQKRMKQSGKSHGISLFEFKAALSKSTAISGQMKSVDKFTKELSRFVSSRPILISSQTIRLILFICIIIAAIWLIVFSVLYLTDKRYLPEANPVGVFSSQSVIIPKPHDPIVK